MKTEELKKKSKIDLEKFLKEKVERLRILRFGLAGGKIKNTREIRETKKDVARILTILRNYEIGTKIRKS